MCISLERLFCLATPQGISIEPRSGGRGIFSREDALGLIARVQHHFPVGVQVLESKIGGNERAEAQLYLGLRGWFEAENCNPKAAHALAKMAVGQVCSANRCAKCKGVGYIDKRYECRSCQGTGHKKMTTTKDMAQTFSTLASQALTEQQFTQIYYDLYMSALDELYQSEGEAASLAAKLLRAIGLS